MVVNFLHESWSYVGVAGAVVILRYSLVINQSGWRGLAWDDLLMFCAMIFYGAETTAAHMIGVWKGLANNAMTDAQRQALDPSSVEWATRVKGCKMNIVGWFTYTTLFWLLKSCWTIYYTRLTEGIYKMDTRIKVAWGLLASTFLACVCVIIFQCWPFYKNWQINPNPGNACQPAYSFLQVSFIMACNTVTDLYLMTIPIPIIWNARLSKKTKISLLVLFSLSWIVVIFGIIRCVTLIRTKEYELSQSGPWSVRESFLAMVVTNAPVVVPLLKRWYTKVSGSVSIRARSKEGSYQLESRSEPKSWPSSKTKKKFHHPLSLPTKYGSDVEITIDQENMGEGGRGFDTKSGKGDIMDSVSEEPHQTLELDHLSPHSRNVAKVTKEKGKCEREDPKGENIMVTREWEVASKDEDRTKKIKRQLR